MKIILLVFVLIFIGCDSGRPRCSCPQVVYMNNEHTTMVQLPVFEQYNNYEVIFPPSIYYDMTDLKAELVKVNMSTAQAEILQTQTYNVLPEYNAIIKHYSHGKIHYRKLYIDFKLNDPNYYQYKYYVEVTMAFNDDIPDDITLIEFIKIKE